MHASTRLQDPGQFLRLATGLAAAALVTGMAMLLAHSVVEAIANPGYSLADGYWVGRLPWMAIIEGLIVAGATSCILIGAATVLALGGWLRRLVVLLPLVVAGLWWFLALARAGISGGACVDCPIPPFDPWAYAYSAPELAFQMLVLPAMAIAVIALTIGAARPESAR
jgi:hypothetical protein